MAINATIMIYVVVVMSGAILAQNSHRVATEAGHMSGGGVGGRKLTSTLTPAVGSEGVVGSSSAPSVCGIPPQTGDEGMSRVGGVVLSSEVEFLKSKELSPIKSSPLPAPARDKLTPLDSLAP